MTLRVLVFAEDVLGMTLARDLLDAVVIHRGPAWLADLWEDATTRDTQRTWAGLSPEAWTTWGAAKDHARRAGLPTHPLGMKGYAAVAYRAAHIAATLSPPPDAVVMCLDTQGDETVRQQMAEGLLRANVRGIPMVLAVAHQEVEAWVAAGYVPTDRAEKDALREVIDAIGFDPTAEPHRLTPDRQTDPRDAKRVSAALLPDGTLSERAIRCWLVESPEALETLSRRATRTGLPEYLRDAERELLPALTGDTRGTGPRTAG